MIGLKYYWLASFSGNRFGCYAGGSLPFGRKVVGVGGRATAIYGATCHWMRVRGNVGRRVGGIPL